MRICPGWRSRAECGYELWRDQVPKARGCTVEQALGDGEDYELLFTIAEAKTGELEREWKADFPRVPLTRIGGLAREPPPATDDQIMASIISHSPAETFAHGKTVAAGLQAGAVLALRGDLGAGKTHFRERNRRRTRRGLRTK